MKILVIVMFILMYVVMIFFQKFRVHAALISAAVFLIAGVMSLSTAIQSVNWNILLMISGTMILVHYFIDSKMPNKLADILLDRSKNMMMVIIVRSLCRPGGGSRPRGAHGTCWHGAASPRPPAAGVLGWGDARRASGCARPPWWNR